MTLELKDIRKSYFQGKYKIEILKGANLKIEKGQSVSIIGESGSGKSTLLGLLAGLDRPDSGQIIFGGQVINGFDEAALTRFRGLNVGIVFQQYHLIPHLTALENVSLPLEINGDESHGEKARLALEDVGLKDRVKHFPNQLSGGECQRVALARSIVHRPKILLADEPSGNLDIKTGEEVMSLMFSLVEREKMTLVLVTHSPLLAKKCSTSYQLADGRLVEVQ